MIKVQELPAERMRSSNNLKQILLGLHAYHDVAGRLPADIRSKDGKPLLSWRVTILPYLDHAHLYKQFKFDEPWDSEHNKKLIPMMPKIYRSPRQGEKTKDHTTYLAPLGKGLCWDDPMGNSFSKIRDGLSNTILLLEADDERAVIWTKPDDLAVDPKEPMKGLLGHFNSGFLAGIGDGSVMFLPKTIPAKDLWSLLTRDGGETIKYPK